MKRLALRLRILGRQLIHPAHNCCVRRNEHVERTTSTINSLFPIFRRADVFPAIALAGALAATACGPLTEASAPAGPPVPPPSAVSPASLSSLAWSADVAAGVVAARADAATEIQSVIERGNAEQAQAISSGDPSVMKDTSTDRYYRELVQINQDLQSNGVTGIHLVNLQWGQVSANGNSATATTLETWRTTFADGTVDQSRDLNLY